MKIIKSLLNDFKGFLVLTLLLYGIAFTYFSYDEKRQEAFFNDMSPIVKNIPTYPGAKLGPPEVGSNSSLYVSIIEHSNIIFNDLSVITNYTESMSQFINGEHREILKFYDEYLTKAGLVFSGSITLIENPYNWKYADYRNKLNYIDTKEGFVWLYADPKNTDRVICVFPSVGGAYTLSAPTEDGDGFVYIAQTVISFKRTLKNSCLPHEKLK